MTKSLLRCEFLAAAGAAAVVMPAASPISAAASAFAAPAANKQARLFPGCCGYSYLKYFKAGSMTLDDFIQEAVDLKSHSVDITNYWLKSTEPEYLTSLRHWVFRNGMALSGIAIRTEMCQADAAKRAEQVRKIQQWVDACELCRKYSSA